MRFHSRGERKQPTREQDIEGSYTALVLQILYYSFVDANAVGARMTIIDGKCSWSAIPPRDYNKSSMGPTPRGGWKEKEGRGKEKEGKRGKRRRRRKENLRSSDWDMAQGRPHPPGTIYSSSPERAR